MTKEEAIAILIKTQFFYFAPKGKEKAQEALDMAIKALKAEPVYLTEIDMESWMRGYEQGKLWTKADMKREAESVRGEWMKWTETIKDETGITYTPHWKCSICNTEYDPYFANGINYCPNCGAKMKGGAK